MNIVKLQKQLQNVPDNALVGYVQNPDGQVPSYLALAEISRRKQMREDYQQQAAPEKSVAEAMVAEAQPQGVAGLPVNAQMFTAPETGIMAPVATAAGGGEVQGHAQEIQRYAHGGEIKHFDGRKGSFVLSGPENPLGLMGANGDLLARINELKKSNPWMTEAALIEKIKSDAAPRPQMPAEEQRMYQGKPSPAPLNYDRPTAKQVIDKSSVPPLASTTVAQPQVGIASTIGRVEYNAPTDFSAEYDANLRPELSAQEAMAKYQGLMGTDVGRQKLNERLAAMETRAAKEEEQAPWMALAKAGLGMAAGKSQFALQNIAEGAQAGLKDLSDAKERLAAKEEKRFNIQSQLAQAERAEKVAAATYGLQSEESIKARNEANRLAKLGYKANLASDKAKGEFEASKANLSADLETAKLGEEKRYHDLWYKTNMEKVNKDAATLEKSIRSNETAQLKALLSESGDRIDKLIAVGVDKTDPLYVSSLQIYNGAANALGLKTGVKTDVPPVGPRKRPLGAFQQ